MEIKGEKKKVETETQPEKKSKSQKLELAYFPINVKWGFNDHVSIIVHIV